MILKSKLSKDMFPLANPADWLIGDWKSLDPVFAGRLANYAKSKLVKIYITEGYRATEYQAQLYSEYLYYKKTGKLGAHKVKLAAKPGTSWHEFRLAIDTSTQPIRNATNAELQSYGLCKPIKSEGWHIQPLETANKANRQEFAPIDLAPALARKFGLADNTIVYLENYKYALALAEGLLAGKKDFSAETMKYLYSYKYWESLREKLGL